MKKIIALFFVISLVLVIGCVNPLATVTKISSLNESGQSVVLEGTISYDRIGQIPFEGCYLNDGTGSIKLHNVLVMESYPPQCQHEGKKVRVTGTYINNCEQVIGEGEIVRHTEGCYAFVNVTSINVIEDENKEKQPETACLNSGGIVTTQMCCLSTEDFYVQHWDIIGACGCSLENSHEVKVCKCPKNEEWNGTTCVVAGDPIERPVFPA